MIRMKTTLKKVLKRLGYEVVSVGPAWIERNQETDSINRTRDMLWASIRRSIEKSTGRVPKVSTLAFEGDCQKLLDILREFGIVLSRPEVPILSEISVDNIRGEVEQFVRSYRVYIDRRLSYQDRRVLIDFSGRYTDYIQFATAKSTIIDVRGEGHSWDQGMLDIFNPHFSLPHFSKLYSYICSLGIDRLLRKLHGGHWRLLNSNIYLNSGVVSTRGMHVDDYNNHSYKLFVYLTDVLSFSEGPYCFAVRSHIPNQHFEAINSIISRYFDKVSTNTFLFPDYVEFMAALGKKGTLILSNQSGAHQGFPQMEAGYRIAAVFHYMRR